MYQFLYTKLHYGTPVSSDFAYIISLLNSRTPNNEFIPFPTAKGAELLLNPLLSPSSMQQTQFTMYIQFLAAEVLT